MHNSVAVDTHLMQARGGRPSVNDVQTLKHFFPCLDINQLIDTKGGIVYDPDSVVYNSTDNTFQGIDTTDSKPITSGSVFDFGTNSFGVLVVAKVVADTNSLYLGNRSVTPFDPAIFVSKSTSNVEQACGFNDVNQVHFTARSHNLITTGQTYIFQLTVDRENNKVTSKVFNITTNRFDTYTEVSILPFTDGTFNSGGTNPTQIITSTTDISRFAVASQISTSSAYSASATDNIYSDLTVATSAANAITVSDAITFNTRAPALETNISDGITAVRRYPDYGAPGSISDAGNEVSVAQAAALTPANYMKTKGMQMFGAAYYSWINGVPVDWDAACNWMSWAWVQGYRVTYPESVKWT